MFQDLNLKALLMEAYYKGSQELLFVIPFVVKTLFGACKAQVTNIPDSLHSFENFLNCIYGFAKHDVLNESS